jgi:hypothetical protein
MKKLFLSVMIILPMMLSAQTVSNLQVSAGSPSTVTFDVSWTAASMTSPWLDSMWVFVDYNKNGKMTRMLITGGTLTAHSPAKPGTGILIAEPDNNKGVWVYGDARTNSPFSATVQLYTDETTMAGACAYASSYPPVGEYVSATEIAFTGTPVYEIKLLHTDGNTVETVEAGSAFLLPCDYTMSSFTDATGAPGVTCLTSAIYTLSTSNLCISAGEHIQFALSGTEPGRKYQLFRNNIAVGAVLSGNGSPATFSGTFDEAGVYTAQTVSDGVYCALPMGGAPVLAAYTAISPGRINNGVTTTLTGIDPNTPVTSVTDASGGSGNITYEWRRSGASPATLTGSAETYDISNDVSNYTAVGTHTINRYAKDATCNTAWVAAAGTYTVMVSMPTRLCEKCCYDSEAASTWVNCDVTTYAYPFNSTTTDTQVVWSGNGTTFYDGARSPYDGRANTEAISSSTVTVNAVQLCKDLGADWYLPAYEELINMSTGVAKEPLNGKGAEILTTSGYHWSSTELYNNGGRSTAANPSFQANVLRINAAGTISNHIKTNLNYVRCARRP